MGISLQRTALAGGLIKKVVLSMCVLFLYIRPALAQGSKVDWQRGLLIARCAKVGDLRSPTRQLATVKAERQAQKECRTRLRKDALQIPVVSGGQKVEAESARSVLEDAVFLLDSDFGSDGSVVVGMALPLDSLRALYFGHDSVVPAVNSEMSTLVVDARTLRIKPSVGVVIKDQKDQYRGPTIFVPAKPAMNWLAQNDKKGVVRVVAKANHHGQLEIPDGVLRGAVESKALVVILWKGIQ